MPGIEEGSDDCQHVRRGREEKTLDLAVFKGRDDGGEEVGNGSRGDHAKDQDHLGYEM